MSAVLPVKRMEADMKTRFEYCIHDQGNEREPGKFSKLWPIWGTQQKNRHHKEEMTKMK
jgi:hypothetical protein